FFIGHMLTTYFSELRSALFSFGQHTYCLNRAFQFFLGSPWVWPFCLILSRKYISIGQSGFTSILLVRFTCWLFILCYVTSGSFQDSCPKNLFMPPEEYPSTGGLDSMLLAPVASSSGLRATSAQDASRAPADTPHRVLPIAQHPFLRGAARVSQ